MFRYTEEINIAELLGDSAFADIVVDLIKTLLIAALLTLIIRTALVETYVVFGPSMEPSIYEGERLLVNKVVFRYRDPRPGEIVVLSEPGGKDRNLVKRVVAVSGQTVEVRNGVLMVDGQSIEEDYVQLRSEEAVPKQMVHDDEVFVMGDNRSNSLDSRYFGPISADQIRGKSFMVFWPLSSFKLLGSAGRKYPFSEIRSIP